MRRSSRMPTASSAPPTSTPAPPLVCTDEPRRITLRSRERAAAASQRGPGTALRSQEVKLASLSDPLQERRDGRAACKVVGVRDPTTTRGPWCRAKMPKACSRRLGSGESGALMRDGEEGPRDMRAAASEGGGGRAAVVDEGGARERVSPTPTLHPSPIFLPRRPSKKRAAPPTLAMPSSLTPN